VPSGPFWGVLVALYLVLAAVAGTEAAVLVAAISLGLAGATSIAIRLADGRQRRNRPAAWQPADLRR
jgi:hypothetical protein